MGLRTMEGAEGYFYHRGDWVRYLAQAQTSEGWRT